MTSAGTVAARGPFAARERRRTRAATVILAMWVLGMGVLARRELFIGRAARLAEAALRITPGATYYRVDRDGAQIGFASTTIDTTVTGIDVIDYFVADLPLTGGTQRASARSTVNLSRGLALRTFTVTVDAPGANLVAGGRADGDSGVVYVLATNGAPTADSQRVAVRGPILLPQLVPLAAVLTERPKVGKTLTLPSFDPATMTQQPMRLAFRAESLFTVVDSAALDTATGTWVSALTDTVRAWRLDPVDAGKGFAGWVDAQGRIVQTTQPGGMVLTRAAYEIAFENWQNSHDRAAATPDASGIIERTAISAEVSVTRARTAPLTVRLRGVDLHAYALNGGRQQLRGDTVRVSVESAAALTPDWSFATPRDSAFKARFRAELAAEPLLQAHDIRIVQQAIRIVGLERDPRVVARKLEAWVFDSLKKEVTFSVPNALEILRTRRGDCNEHTQLYVAFARALGMPARIATGLAYVRGKFYYHAWPEVWLGDWVAVDPTFGQFPADAAHLRFQVGGLLRQAELLPLMGNLKIDVLEGN